MDERRQSEGIGIGKEGSEDGNRLNEPVDWKEEGGLIYHGGYWYLRPMKFNLGKTEEFTEFDEDGVWSCSIDKRNVERTKERKLKRDWTEDEKEFRPWYVYGEIVERLGYLEKMRNIYWNEYFMIPTMYGASNKRYESARGGVFCLVKGKKIFVEEDDLMY